VTDTSFPLVYYAGILFVGANTCRYKFERTVDYDYEYRTVPQHRAKLHKIRQIALSIRFPVSKLSSPFFAFCGKEVQSTVATARIPMESLRTVPVYSGHFRTGSSDRWTGPNSTEMSRM
jgi:hypothetical protein